MTDTEGEHSPKGLSNVMMLAGQFMSTLCLTLQGTPLLQPHLRGSEASNFLSDLIPCFSQLPPYWSHQPLDDTAPPQHSSWSTIQFSPQMTLLKACFADLLTPIMRSIHKPFGVWVAPCLLHSPDLCSPEECRGNPGEEALFPSM